jgi:hypothetical protein
MEEEEKGNVCIEDWGGGYTPMGGVFLALGGDDILRYVGILG